MCGHESPAGSSFCLNCGSSLAQVYAQTPPAAPGLPAIGVCGMCRAENPVGMNFCRGCGSALPGAAPVSQGGYAAPGFAGTAPPSAAGGPMAGFPSGPLDATRAPGAPGALGGPGAPIAMAPGQIGPLGSLPTPATPMAYAAPAAATVACTRCSAVNPVGFAFCQQCGQNLQSAPPAPPDPGPAARPRTPSMAPAASGLRYDAPIDPHAGTLAHDGPAAHVLAAIAAAPRAVGVWGTAVLVNRDGSDGQRFALAGEYVVIGRAGADIAFDDDRFLARQHARLERQGDGAVRVIALDSLNGVFRKSAAPIELTDGTTVLVGREVLRFERLAPEEVKVHPLVRHGVALFGSPPRDPWGRFVQLVPSGGYRDVRHLMGDEVVLGREEGDLVFRDDAFMSRRHAAVTWDGARAQIVDLGSSNGTFVRITGPTPIVHGDHVRMGDQLLRVELGG